MLRVAFREISSTVCHIRGENFDRRRWWLLGPSGGFLLWTRRWNTLGFHQDEIIILLIIKSVSWVESEVPSLFTLQTSTAELLIRFPDCFDIIVESIYTRHRVFCYAVSPLCTRWRFVTLATRTTWWIRTSTSHSIALAQTIALRWNMFLYRWWLVLGATSSRLKCFFLLMQYLSLCLQQRYLLLELGHKLRLEVILCLKLPHQARCLLHLLFERSDHHLTFADKKVEQRFCVR